MAKKTTKASKVSRLEGIFKKLFIAAFVIFLAIFAVDFQRHYTFDIRLKNDSNKTVVDVIQQANSSLTSISQEPRKPKYWFYMARKYMWIFLSVDTVLQRLGLEKIEMEIVHDKKVHNDWDLLWSYDYHNEIPIDFKNVSYHQRINHIPGNFVLTMKDNLAINTDSKYIPKGFNDTEILKNYAAEHPNTRYVQKLWSNRGVALRNISDMNFEIFGPGYKYFAQVYVENPLLIDRHKFDFGIYVVITSINPLRVYYYVKNTLIRLCTLPYDPNETENLDTYVISDSCLFPWDFPALSMYYDKAYTYKQAMNAYFIKKGYDVAKIWTQVEDCIREIVLSKENTFIYWVKRYKFKYTFFELYRFDFILDDQLNLFLIEINQSPNINPSRKLYRDKRLFENLLFNTFTLIGVGKYVHRENFKFGSELEEQMICHEESLTVFPETCANRPCNETCSSKECEHCWSCLSVNQKHDQHLAYREMKNRGAFKRIFPPPIDDMNAFSDDYLDSLSPVNRHHTEWFIEMCSIDDDFC